VEVFNEKDEPLKVELPEIKSAGIRQHQTNFIDAIRSGAALNAGALTGHLSSSLPHLANLACRVGRSFRFDPQREAIIGDDEANQLLERTYRDHWSRPTESKSRITS
jgi:hypothetical protein